LTGPTAGL
jgi:hypothetical protein